MSPYYPLHLTVVIWHLLSIILRSTGKREKLLGPILHFFNAIIYINNCIYLTGWVDLWLLKNWLNLTLVATGDPWMNHSECAVVIFSLKNKKKTPKLSKSYHKGRNMKKKIRMSQTLIQIIQQWGVCTCVRVHVWQDSFTATHFFCFSNNKKNSVDTLGVLFLH